MNANIDVWRGVRRGPAGVEFFCGMGSPDAVETFRRRRQVAADVR
jgi:hypothetical protein